MFYSSVASNWTFSVVIFLEELSHPVLAPVLEDRYCSCHLFKDEERRHKDVRHITDTPAKQVRVLRFKPESVMLTSPVLFIMMQEDIP